MLLTSNVYTDRSRTASVRLGSACSFFDSRFLVTWSKHPLLLPALLRCGLWHLETWLTIDRLLVRRIPPDEE